MITQQEFEAILDDGTKRIEGDLRWRNDEDHSPAQEFRVQVFSEPGWPLTVIGWWNPRSGKLSYTMRHDAAGRILGLDLGRRVAHRNPSSERLYGTHKHRWTDRFRDKQAYIPDDITAEWDQPVEVWQQFCSEVRITHLGTMDYPSLQEELPL